MPEAAEPTPADAEAWIALVLRAYAESIEHGNRCWQQARTVADGDAAAASALARAAMLGLERMGADEPTSFGMLACEALRHFGGAPELERLRLARPSLPPRPGLRDWRRDADRAIAVIEGRVLGRCACLAESGSGAPVWGPLWEVEAETVDAQRCCCEITARCTACGARWSVLRDDGYHYPQYHWTRL